MRRPKDLIENTVEWIDREDRAVITTSIDSSFYRKLSKYFEEHNDLRLVTFNDDGNVTLEVPVKWIKITPPRKVSDHLRKSASERAKKRHEKEKWRNIFRQCGNDANDK